MNANSTAMGLGLKLFRTTTPPGQYAFGGAQTSDLVSPAKADTPMKATPNAMKAKASDRTTPAKAAMARATPKSALYQVSIFKPCTARPHISPRDHSAQRGAFK